MYDREVRSGNSRRKVRNKGGTTTRRPSLTLLDPLLMNFRARVSHHHSPCRAAVRTCRAAMELTYKAIRQACIPPTVRANLTKNPSPRIDPGERPADPGWNGKRGTTSRKKNEANPQSLGQENPLFFLGATRQPPGARRE